MDYRGFIAGTTVYFPVFVPGALMLGQCVEYEVGNVYDYAYTMVCKIPKSILAQLPARTTP